MLFLFFYNVNNNGFYLTLSLEDKNKYRLKVIKDMTVSKNNQSNTGEYLFEQSRSLMEIVCVISLIVSFVRLDYSSPLTVIHVCRATKPCRGRPVVDQGLDDCHNQNKTF